MITLRLPDGTPREYPLGTTAADVAKSIGSRLAKSAVAAVVNGEQVDLTAPVPDGANLAIVTRETEDGREVLRHSTAHVMAQAVVALYPGAKFTIGPAITDGFYYDFELPEAKTFSEDDLDAIEAKMREIIAQNQPFVRSEVTVDEALALFADQPYKCEIIERVTSAESATDETDAVDVAPGSAISVYRNTDTFVDLCRGLTFPPRARSDISGCDGLQVPTGAATKRVRCCSGSTAPHGSQRRARRASAPFGRSGKT
jgi:threonyl-tRNA synthetase